MAVRVTAISHRRRIRWLTLALAGLGALTLVPLVAASPAQTFRTTGCATYYNITQCGESWGMAKQVYDTVNPAGNAIMVSNWHVRQDVYVDGVLALSQVDNNHVFGEYKFIVEPAFSTPHINHPRFRSSWTLADGTTCSSVYNLMYHDDQIVHEITDFSCESPSP